MQTGDGQTGDVFDFGDLEPEHAEVAEAKAEETAAKATDTTQQRLAGQMGGFKTGQQKPVHSEGLLKQEAAQLYGEIIADGTSLGWPADSSRAFTQTVLLPNGHPTVANVGDQDVEAVAAQVAPASDEDLAILWSSQPTQPLLGGATTAAASCAYIFVPPLQQQRRHRLAPLQQRQCRGC
jgi:hypothetical protein